MSEQIRVVKLDRDEMRRLRQAELDKLGMTWEQLVDCLDDCQCCVTLPEEFSHLSEYYVQRVWENFDWMKLDD